MFILSSISSTFCHIIVIAILRSLSADLIVWPTSTRAPAIALSPWPSLLLLFCCLTGEFSAVAGYHGVGGSMAGLSMGPLCSGRDRNGNWAFSGLQFC